MLELWTYECYNLNLVANVSIFDVSKLAVDSNIKF